MWHRLVVEKLRESGMFADVTLIGAKVRAFRSESLFLDVHSPP